MLECKLLRRTVLQKVLEIGMYPQNLFCRVLSYVLSVSSFRMCVLV